MNKDLACDNLIQQITKAWPLDRWDEFGVVVAVSGGADSVALLKALAEIKKQSTSNSGEAGRLVVAHFNHQMRGRESDMDAEFVVQLANQMELNCVVESAAERNTESENDLRNERYQFLVGVARKTNSRYIVTAHHRDDQIETVLFRLFRGTGLKGICGIPARRVMDETISIVRPMLNVEKKLIEKSLNSWNQPWREDASNAFSRYTRNFLRNEILPMLRDRFPDVDGSIARLSKQAGQQAIFLAEEAAKLMEYVNEDGGAMVFDCQSLSEHSPVLLRELFVDVFRQQLWSTSQLGYDELDHLTTLVIGDADEPRFQLPGGINCERIAGKLRLGKN